MKIFRAVRILATVLAVAMAAFFLWSGYQKLLDLSAFTKSVGNFELEWKVTWNGENRNFFAEPVDAIIAYTVPWVEIMAALALLLPVTRVAGGVVFLGLLASFNWALYSAWDKGIKDLKCGCHGVSAESTDYALKIGSNFALMAAILILFFLKGWQRRLVRKEENSRVSA